MALTRIAAAAQAWLVGGALLLALSAAAGPAPHGAVRLAGHDAVDPALRRFTGKVVRLGPAGKSGRVSTLRFAPVGPGMVAPRRNELRGWRLTFIRGKLFGRSLWIQRNTASELTVRDTDPSLGSVVEGDIMMIELLDPAKADPNA